MTVAEVCKYNGKVAEDLGCRLRTQAWESLAMLMRSLEMSMDQRKQVQSDKEQERLRAHNLDTKDGEEDEVVIDPTLGTRRGASLSSKAVEQQGAGAMLRRRMGGGGGNPANTSSLLLSESPSLNTKAYPDGHMRSLQSSENQSVKHSQLSCCPQTPCPLHAFGQIASTGRTSTAAATRTTSRGLGEDVVVVFILFGQANPFPVLSESLLRVRTHDNGSIVRRRPGLRPRAALSLLSAVCSCDRSQNTFDLFRISEIENKRK